MLRPDISNLSSRNSKIISRIKARTPPSNHRHNVAASRTTRRQYNPSMYILRLFLAALLLPGLAVAQQQVSFPTQDGGVVSADMYGKGERGVVLAHGGRFTKESWETQAPVLVKAGFRVLAIDFRGRGQSRGPQSKSGDDGVEYDVLAAVRYLRATGAKTVSVDGASFGGE